MTKVPLVRSISRWARTRRRWPLTRQISAVFAVTMLANAVLVIAVSDVWSAYALERSLGEMSPQAQRAYRSLQAGGVPAASDLNTLNTQLQDIEARLHREANLVLTVLVALAAVLTFGIGHIAVGRLGRGLGNVADAARRIAGGDLTARASRAGFASREEAQLAEDFNTMSASLQRAERELAESTASIAHELRTPLTVLAGRLHGIADGVFALEPAEVSGLLYQVEGLGRLVNDLQTLSLANARRLILTPEHTDLAEEVRRVLAATGPDLDKAGLDVAPLLDDTPLLADGARLRQVIAAILSNAVRYAAHSGPLRITTQSDGEDVILEIVDHGPGLPPGSEDLAFDRFWRGEASRSRNTGGSGLGLAVVRAIVEAHGGTASLRNHEGGGTIFEMQLRREPALHIFSTQS